MKSRIYSSLGFVFTVGLMSGCSGSDTMPIVPPAGPAAAAEEQRVSQSDALTPQEAALVGQANSEPGPAPLPDL
ncbi:MAG: hypothetical protein NDI90_07255 [Nitrospira sp. BO4]|jgi:hypothetical protein|nr:hypothetical protein [Nitrospira sp. BO4]